MSATNEQKVEALKAARRMIEEKRHSYICNALDQEVADGSAHLSIAAAELCAYMHASLGGPRGFYKFDPTLENWQTDNGLGSRASAQTRADRLAWIDWMILCLEGWEPHNGGVPPADGGVYVLVKFRNGELHKRYSRNFRWFNWLEHGLSGPPQTAEERAQGHEHDIVAWRVAKP